jgi:valyl-tRNA synthetase
MAQANNLPIIKVIDEDGLIHQGFGNFSGLKVEEARELVVSELKKRNLMISEEDLTNNLSICYRCNTPIEPLPSKQWFVSVDKKLDRFKGLSLKEKSLQVFKDNQIKFIQKDLSKI